VLAAVADARLRLRVHLDERCAGFFALGLGLATGHPAAVITTSGTATANLLPPVVEASRSEVPLLLLTADRPHRLRGGDANQAIDQPGIYGSYVRASHDLAPPSLDPREIRHLRALAARAVADATGAPAGPVHLNIPFDKPLEPPAGEAVPDPRAVVPAAWTGEPPGRPVTRIGRRRPGLDPSDADALLERLEDAARPVIVAGPVPDPHEVGPAAVGLAGTAGIPLLADPLSGARWRSAEDAAVLGAYDLFLGVPEVRARLAPDFVLRVGRSPTSKHLAAWLEEHAGAEQVVLDTGHLWKDHAVTAAAYVRADPAAALAELARGAGRRPAGSWTRRWLRTEARARAAVREAEAFGPGHEGAILSQAVAAVPPGEELFVGSSMPVRDLDAFGIPESREPPVVARANRGASGIDGTVSTALGVAAGTGRRVVAVMGDIAFYHDMNGLLAAREGDAEVLFVVVHNDGGGIFHMLPVREREPAFTPYFATPHGLEFRHAAALHGIPHTRLDDPAGFPRALADALAGGGTRILEVRTDRDDNEARHRRVRDAVRAAVLDEPQEDIDT
jgi:2-succinyl-5-enolpyruvyl-6-hydroxy-3-cyclohexene-1-carboxylate synthase